MEKLEINSEDFEDLLVAIEDSLQIKYNYDEIDNQISIVELIDLVVAKIGLKEGNECSSQIVFFRLRHLLSKKLQLDSSQITLETNLEDIFPYKGRRKQWEETFSEIDFQVPKLCSLIPQFACLTAFISFFFIFGEYWNYGLCVFVISVDVFRDRNKYSTTLPVNNLKELTEYIATHDYRTTRNRVGTYNLKEVQKIILGLFTDYSGVGEDEKITLKTKIVYC